jgi:hypothetical protein
MIELELDIEALEALLDHLKTVSRPPALDHAFKMLQDAHADAAEQYWTNLWSGQ